MPRHHFLALGPAIPIVPRRDFSKFELTHDEWAAAWTIIGPSVEANMSAFRTFSLPQWKIYTACYLEGLLHGSSLSSAE